MARCFAAKCLSYCKLFFPRPGLGPTSVNIKSLNSQTRIHQIETSETELHLRCILFALFFYKNTFYNNNEARITKKIENTSNTCSALDEKSKKQECDFFTSIM